MKIYPFISLAILLLLACNNSQQQSDTPLIHINYVTNRLSLLSDTSLSVKFLATPPKGLSRILLVSGNMVLNVANIDNTFKNGDTISLNYPFKNHHHYALYAVGVDPGNEYYDMSAYDFTLDIKTRSVLNLQKRRP